MREYIKLKQLTEKEHDDTQMKEWLSSSHYWVEKMELFIVNGVVK